MPLISVCIPTYNGRTTIERTLLRVLDQEGVDLEVVVVDDASSDGTVDFVRQRFSLIDRVRICSFAERLGIVGNWNRALAHATGDFVAIVGQDDEVDPDWASTLTAALARHPEAGLAFCRRRFAYDSDAARVAMASFFDDIYPRMLEPFYARLDEVGECVDTETMVRAALVHDFETNLVGEPAFQVFRRTSPVAREGYDAAMGQMIDWEFALRFIAAGPIVHCSRQLGTYHIRAAGVSVDNAKDLSRHDREFAHLLSVVLARFDRWLAADERERLEARRQASLH
ncbi:MAG TPA: glycosyltransferase family 2 protein, partial [Planctomycetota bacterium]|nr:glycosyltransferase family 2 protein [Planctomycetota bacterium]